MRLEILRGDADRLLALAAAAHPLECCGLLLGRDRRVLEVVPAANVADDPARRFEVDPATLLATHRRARDQGLAVLGSYHSHPTGDPRPSAEDARGVATPTLCLVVAAGAVSAWRGGGGASFEPVDLRILD